MAWYAYCLVEQQAFNLVRARKLYPILNLRGIGGAQVFAFPSGDFAVTVSEYLPGAADQRALLAHAQVVAECFRRGIALPLRFGTVFESEDCIRAAIRNNRKVFTSSVEELRGKAEMRLKIQLPEGQLAANGELRCGAGGAFLEELRVKAVRDRERQSRLRNVALQVNRALNPQKEEIACRTNGSVLTVSIAHLIDSEAVPDYQRRYQSVARQLRHCEVAMTGPHPPYHFVPSVRPVSES